MFIVKDCDFFLRSEVITQLAAKEISTGTNFNRYIIPKIPISASAERVDTIGLKVMQFIYRSYLKDL